jgi:hypothetical protein
MYSEFELADISVAGSFSGDEDGVPSRSGRRIANDLSQTPLNAIAHHGITDTFSGYEAEAAAVQAIRKYSHHQETVSHATPSAMDFRDTAGAAQPMVSLHRIEERRRRAKQPTDSWLHGQPVPALETPAAQDGAPV